MFRQCVQKNLFYKLGAECRLDENNERLLGRINHGARSVYTSNRCVTLELFTHEHLPLYQQLNTQLAYLGEIITKLKYSDTPMHILLILEKEYQALSLFLEQKVFLELYLRNQEIYEKCRIDMVQWYNKLAITHADDFTDYNNRLNSSALLNKQLVAQKQSLIAILYQTKEAYEKYLSIRYTKETDINTRWHTYFGDLLWFQDAGDIRDLNGRSLSIQMLWQKIESIFSLSRRPFYRKDSPIKNILIDSIQSLQGDAGIVFNPELKRYELIKNYQLQFDLITTIHCSVIDRLKSNPIIQSIPRHFFQYRQRVLKLINNTKREEQQLVDFISRRVKNVIKMGRYNARLHHTTDERPTLLVNAVLQHMLRHYSQITAYLHGIATAGDFWKTRQNHKSIQGKSTIIPLPVTKLCQLLSKHKNQMLLLQTNTLSPKKDYSLHLEKIAFCEALFELNQQYMVQYSRGMSAGFFLEDSLTQQIFESCYHLTSSNLSQIDESIEKLQKLYRLIHLQTACPNPEIHEKASDLTYHV